MYREGKFKGTTILAEVESRLSEFLGPDHGMSTVELPNCCSSFILYEVPFKMHSEDSPNSTICISMGVDFVANPLANDLCSVIDHLAEACRHSNNLSFFSSLLHGLNVLRRAVHHLAQASLLFQLFASLLTCRYRSILLQKPHVFCLRQYIRWVRTLLLCLVF
jgi:hypothetical protein